MNARSQNGLKVVPPPVVRRRGVLRAEADVGAQRAVFGLLADVPRDRPADAVVDVVGQVAGEPPLGRHLRARHRSGCRRSPCCIRPARAHSRPSSGRCRCRECSRTHPRTGCRSSHIAPALPSQACRRLAPQRPRPDPPRSRGEEFSPSSSQPPLCCRGGIGLRRALLTLEAPPVPFPSGPSRALSLSPGHRSSRKERHGDAPLRRAIRIAQGSRHATTKRHFEHSETSF